MHKCASWNHYYLHQPAMRVGENQIELQFIPTRTGTVLHHYCLNTRELSVSHLDIFSHSVNVLNLDLTNVNN